MNKVDLGVRSDDVDVCFFPIGGMFFPDRDVFFFPIGEVFPQNGISREI